MIFEHVTRHFDVSGVDAIIHPCREKALLEKIAWTFDFPWFKASGHWCGMDIKMDAILEDCAADVLGMI
jgi:hypothetical protein